ncbi:MAG: hypothetical protein IKP95_12275 [Ruminococcus sp.]|nr:hypothetical protein [Ruminococcus sp.]
MTKEQLLSGLNAPAVMSAFARTSLKDYFTVLENITEDEKYRSLYEQILEYTRLDDYCHYDFDEVSESTPYRKDVTVGEMLYASFCLFGDVECHKSDKDGGRRVEAAARLIVRNIVVIPLGDIRIKYYIQEVKEMHKHER